MFNKIYILNEDRHQHKLNVCRDLLLRAGVPDFMIDRWVAKSHVDYKFTGDMCTRAAAAGHQLFRNLLDDKSYNDCHIGYLAQTWSYLDFFRWVADSGRPAVLIHDNAFFQGFSWGELVEAYEDRPDGFEFGAISTDADEGDFYNGFWSRSFGTEAHDWCMLVMPAGAEALLDHFNQLDSLPLGWAMAAMRQAFAGYDSAFSFFSRKQWEHGGKGVWKDMSISTLHHPVTGEVLRPCHETSDAAREGV